MALFSWNQVTAVILAGGLGTRLRSVVADRPKVLAEVHGRPFLAYLFDQVRRAGVGAAVVCTGYRGEQVQAAFGSGYHDLRLIYSHEAIPLGTGGAVRLAQPLLQTQWALVMNGDSYYASDLEAFRRWHLGKAAQATILLTEVPDTARYGRVLVEPDGRVASFAEKGAASGPGWINAGLYLIKTDRLATIPEGRAVSLEREVFPAWAGQGLYGCQSEGRFLDIGTPETLAQAEAFLSDQQVIQ
jgi:D-glycero-alpha-D-manno-heptose 1-phosphate guanylyltransferase